MHTNDPDIRGTERSLPRFECAAPVWKTPRGRVNSAAVLVKAQMTGRIQVDENRSAHAPIRYSISRYISILRDLSILIVLWRNYYRFYEYVHTVCNYCLVFRMFCTYRLSDLFLKTNKDKLLNHWSNYYQFKWGYPVIRYSIISRMDLIIYES